jgi:hypothetical protein
MLYGVEVAVCSETNTKHIYTVWAESTVIDCYTRWCITQPVVFKRLNVMIFQLCCYSFWTTQISDHPGD